MAEAATVGRIFVAIRLTDDVRHGLAAHLDTWCDELPGRPVPPPNWHMTLRFLGKCDRLGYEQLLAALGDDDLGPPFVLGFGGLGAFPRPSKAAVLWLSTGRGSDELSALAATVEDAVVRAGFMPEERPFHPHLTLSRIRPPLDVRAVVEGVPRFPLALPVDAVTVYRSHLQRGPARYEALEEFRL